MDSASRISSELSGLAIGRIVAAPRSNRGVDEYDDAELVCPADRLFAVDHQRLPGLNHQGSRMVAMKILDGFGSDGGDVEPAILLGLGNLDQCPPAAPAELSGAFDHAVSALDRLDRDHFLLLD